MTSLTTPPMILPFNMKFGFDMPMQTDMPLQVKIETGSII